MSLFVDSSAWFAALDAGDVNHARATKVLRDEPLVTSDHVVVETHLLVARKVGREAAERFWAGLRGGAARVEVVVRGDFDTAWEVGQDFPDQDFSIVDRTSFAVMGRLGITAVATFDDHFAIYRYGPRRERAFEIRR